ncbi:MAG TPA: 1-deoxy-D-xylulose-5-phosphate synthase [Solirubrobacteraceae bacterium]|jgi:1-deoxy-D-xylulose-5-phosphate synthase|nr:1-deoxy-D-xylulose-5-phosphate synthase [Solirubrobacteraceae bacterium]
MSEGPDSEGGEGVAGDARERGEADGSGRGGAGGRRASARGRGEADGAGGADGRGGAGARRASPRERGEADGGGGPGARRASGRAGGSLLSRVDGPDDLRALSEEELQRLAQEVREHIIDTVGEIGGHFGANLGTCELAVALHSLLHSPRDKILWDVGHQAYPHKILTGRRERLCTIRQYGGLAPFCSIAESPHDIIGAGHASTSVGYAVGMREGMRHLDAADQGKVVAVIGDGAMTGGVAFEAIGQAGGLGTPIVVVLNDNGMSISPNVGALSRYFNRVRLNPKLWHAREGVEGGLARLPGAVGAAFERLGPQLKESLKAFWAPGLWWEELDWAYMGVIDGHDVRALRVALREALAAQRPVVVHIATVKGKGFAPAEDGGLEGMEKWHAAKPHSILNGSPTPPPAASARAGAAAARGSGAGGHPPPSPLPYTQVFGEALVRECERDRRVVGITAAMNSGTGLNILQKALPERYFDVGIAEQQAILFAAGLSLQGVKPVAAIYSTFLQRAYDQIVHDVCLQRLNVVFAMDRAGLVGDDGPTHHGAFDIAYLRCLPHIVLMAPRDEAMLVHMLRTALLYDDGPIALRYPRGEGPGAPLPPAPCAIPIGTGEILREAGRAAGATVGSGVGAGRRVALVGYGTGVGKALEAASLLEGHGLGVTVADARFAKPIDAALMAQLAAEHDLLVTVEEGVLAGGFGSAVWETLSELGAGSGGVRIMRVGLPDRYVTHGKPSLLHEEVGFTGAKIAERVAAAILARDSAAVG